MPSQKPERAIALQENISPLQRSTLPSILQFPLVLLLSLTLSSLLYTFISDYTSGDLASVSRTLEAWWEVGALVGWRTFELALGWFGGYDSHDLVSLTLLAHGPPLYLLSAFYEVQSTTIVSSLLIDCLTTYIPFRLLRPLSRVHVASPISKTNPPDTEIVTDVSIQTITTLLAASIYSVVLYASMASRLPVYLATHFNNIPSVAAAHRASPVSLLPITLVFGIAAKSFIFTPTAFATITVDDGPAFDPITATLSETLQYNLWGYSPRVKVTIQRTTALVLVCGINTFVQSFVTIDGVEMVGAAVYSGVWMMAATITGVALGVVGAV